MNNAPSVAMSVETSVATAACGSCGSFSSRCQFVSENAGASSMVPAGRIGR